MKKLAFALGAIVVPFVFACSSAPRTSSTSAASSLAQEGDRCGGFVAHPQQCDESQNLYCKYSHVPDVPGTCTSCNGFGRLPQFAKICQDGSEDSPHWVAQNGTCQMVVCPNDTGAQASVGDDGGTGDDASGDDASSGDDGGSQPATCNDFDPCPADQTCIDPNTGLPATNGAPGVCQ